MFQVSARHRPAHIDAVRLSRVPSQFRSAGPGRGHISYMISDPLPRSNQGVYSYRHTQDQFLYC